MVRINGSEEWTNVQSAGFAVLAVAHYDRNESRHTVNLQNDHDTMPDGSVTHWIRLLQEGDHVAAQPLWERYFAQLEAIARKRMRGASVVVADAEDVALSAMDSLFRGLQQGRYPQLRDRDNLLRLLVVITARKVSHLLRDQQRQKRGGGWVARPPSDDIVNLEKVIGPEPTPEFAAQVAEHCEFLMALLPREDLKQVALLKLEGYTNREISKKLECAPRTIDRKLHVIRRVWEDEGCHE